MNLENTFEEVVKKISKSKCIVYEGTVIDVDKTNNTCNVSRENLPDVLNVRLNSILESGTDVVTIYPKSGSKVIILIIEDNQNDAYVISTNNVEEIKGKISNSEFSITSEGWIIKRDKSLKEILTSVIEQMSAITVTNGAGITGVPNNKAAIDAIKNDVNNLFRA